MRLAGVILASLSLVGAAAPRPARTPDSIAQTLALGPHAGDCDQCHSMHGQSDIVYPHALIGPDENALCDKCHTQPWAGGSYAGPWFYTGTSHSSGSGAIWPGPVPPPRTEVGAAGKCLNCHDPHGLVDATGLVPSLNLAREEKLCLTCHDGSPAFTNIGSELAKPYRHPVTDYAGRHTGPAESQPSDFGVTPLNQRHAECVDCHDPHVSGPDLSGPPAAPAPSRTTFGVSRVLVQNGGPGSLPGFQFVAGQDTLSTPIAEYQLCFKCHSSWTTQPSGQTDLALQLNPANASYHPVEATGADPNIAPGSFTPGWSASSLTRCDDCHGSDFVGAPRGPHGSSYRYILKQPYTASSQTRTMTPNELCFSCHAYDTYANPAAAPAVLAYSRFNSPGAGKGHAEHVGQEGVPCYACHVTHGAPAERHLLVTGRSPGILSFSESPGGGTCQPTCHNAQSYTVNYAR